MAQFSEYQSIKSMQYLYTTPELAKQFKTKKLLGIKKFKLTATPTCEATEILDLKAEGVKSVQQEYDAQLMIMSYILHL